MNTPTVRRDVVDILVEDHREIEDLFVMLEGGLGEPKRRRDVADVMIAELVRHAVAEEAYVYPTAREKLPNGEAIAEHEISEHNDAEQLMRVIEDLDATDPQFAMLVSDLAALIRHHVADEETNLFPALREACDEATLVKLGERVETAKKLAPTRPHPSMPDHPPLNKLVAPGAGLVDRLRDALSGRPTSLSEL